MLAVIIGLSFLVLFLIFRLYMSQFALCDMMVLLIQQVWELREFCLLSKRGSPEGSMKFNQHALALPGPKGELLIRRHLLLWNIAEDCRGIMTEQLNPLLARVKDIDRQLVCYNIHLRTITELTVKMIEDIYNDKSKSSLNVTLAIVRKLRVV